MKELPTLADSLHSTIHDIQVDLMKIGEADSEDEKVVYRDSYNDHKQLLMIQVDHFLVKCDKELSKTYE